VEDALMLRTALALTFLSGMALASHAEQFTFVALGDNPYGEPEKVYAPFEGLIGAINAAKPDLVVHIGDIKSGSTPCSDQMLTDQLNFINTLEAPVLYTPGDNEWTDCHRKRAGEFDPIERLGFLRRTFFADPGKSLGKTPVEVKSQADKGYPENARLFHKGVMFITAHVVGSNNNFEIRDPRAAEEFFARDEANKRWLKNGFEAATEQAASAVVVAIQADMFEFDWNEFDDETWLRHSGFANFGPALQEAAKAFGKPVLLVYGDSHIFRVIRPFPKTAPNVTALEVFGDPDMHAVSVMVDTDDPAVFGFRPLVNPSAPPPPAG
jgi:hypothetical protein